MWKPEPIKVRRMYVPSRVVPQPRPATVVVTMAKTHTLADLASLRRAEQVIRKEIECARMWRRKRTP